MSVKIKVTVVCHIQNRVLIRHSVVLNFHRVIFSQCICHFDFHCSWISLISVSALQRKCKLIVVLFYHIPDTDIEEIHPTVQIITIIILCKSVSLSIQLKRSSPDPVRTSPDNCSKKLTCLFIFLWRIISKHNIFWSSIFIFDDHLY